ncbi:hypothetical protein CPAV1605_1136 [seawater metagenome]|uniref:Uncharacterized protein n=1 Tax=seawater metagenome TaxID=1561972 RepID=A0A5E8CLW3_9ZZZZ
MDWSNFDNQHLSIINLSFKKKYFDDNYLKEFKEKWLEIESKAQPYHLIINTQNLGYISFRYCYELAKINNVIKNRKKIYLKKIIYIINNSYMDSFLELLYNISKPIVLTYVIQQSDYLKIKPNMNKVHDKELEKLLDENKAKIIY